MSSNNYGLQDDGSFRRKTVQSIREDLRTDVERILGDSVDLSPGSPHGQILDLATLELAAAWETMQAVYNAISFRGAYGIQLDRLLSLVGVDRLERRPATGEVTFSRETAASTPAVIQSGTLVTTPLTDDTPTIPFRTTERAEIPADQTAVSEVPIRGLFAFETTDETVNGSATNVAAQTIQVIADPVSGVSAVTNPLPTGDTGQRADGSEYDFQTGRDRESDAAYRRRYANSLGLSGKATPDAIRSNVLNADETVRSVAFEENTTMNDNTATGGLPRKSFRVTVRGGDPDNIAQAIATTRSAGIEAYGSVVGTATFDDGSQVDEYHDPASEIAVYVDVTVNHDATFPSDGIQQIKDRLIAYIGGTTSSGDYVSGTEVGTDVMHYLVENACGLDSVYNANAFIGTSVNPDQQADITIARNEFAETSIDNITVTPVEGEVP